MTRATPRDTEIQPHTQQVVITPTFSPAENLSITTTATSVLGDDEVVNAMPGLGAGMLPRLHTTGLLAKPGVAMIPGQKSRSSAPEELS